jgi:hypothetical protein
MFDEFQLMPKKRNAFTSRRAQLTPHKPPPHAHNLPLDVRLTFKKIIYLQQELSAIWSMGFEADVVRRALIQAGGSEEHAVNLIVSDRLVI